jgi:NodT family efflux transporter outer membrane factor (OMF) lipoprotein
VNAQGSAVTYRWQLVLTAIALLTSCGCTSIHEYVSNGFKVGPNYREPPPAPIADDWIDAGDPRLQIGPTDHTAWWRVFRDPTLDQLIHMSYEQNLTLREAGQRIEEVRMQRRVAAGNFFPQTQVLTGDYTRSMRSLSGNAVPGIPAALLGPRELSNWRLGSSLAWELDFWGRYRRAIEAADARWDASIAGYDDVLVLLLAEVATTYVELRTAEQRLSFARQNIELQRESARIADARLRAQERDSEIDAPQAKANLAQTSAIYEELEISRRAAQNRLAVLLGMPPQDLSHLVGPGSVGPGSVVPVAPESIAINLPADLLRRRPDIRRAERDVAAQTAEIGIATTDLYPQITVNGSLSLEARQFADLFHNNAWAGSVGPAFRWNVLNYGRLISKIGVQNARLQQAATRYQQTVLEANEEAENAIVSFRHFHNEVKLLEESVRHAEEAVRVASAKYLAGAVDFNRLFTLQQLLVSQQDQLAASRGNLATSVIRLYKAVGGGWEIRLHGEDLADPVVGNTGLVPVPEEIQ